MRHVGSTFQAEGASGTGSSGGRVPGVFSTWHGGQGGEGESPGGEVGRGRSCVASGLLLRGKWGASGGCDRGVTRSDTRHSADQPLCGRGIAEAEGGSRENNEGQVVAQKRGEGGSDQDGSPQAGSGLQAWFPSPPHILIWGWGWTEHLRWILGPLPSWKLPEMGDGDISLPCHLVLLLPRAYCYWNISFIYVYTYGLSPSLEGQDFVLPTLDLQPRPDAEGSAVRTGACWGQ